MPRPPGGGRSPPLPLSRPRAELFLTSLLAPRGKSPVHSLAPQLMPTPSVVTQAIVSCVFVRVGARFVVQWRYFYFQSRAGTVISSKRQKNQIKSNILCQLVFAPNYSIHIFASFTNLLSIFWTKHVLGIIQMKDA